MVGVERAAQSLASAAGFSCFELRRLELGLSSELFAVEVDARREAVVKLHTGFVSRVHAERASLRHLAKRAPELAVPRLLAASVDGEHPGLCLSWLPGAESDLELAAKGLDDEALQSVMAALGRWCASLHAVEVEEGSGVKFSEDPLPLAERLLRQARSAAERLSRQAEADHAALGAEAMAWLERAWSRIEVGPRRMVHRDLRPANVVLDAQGRFVGVVDLEHGAGAHPAWDFAKLDWWCFDRLGGRDSFEAAYLELAGELPEPEHRRLFRVHEALTMLAYFHRRNSRYAEGAVSQLRAEIEQRPPPRWRS